MGNRGGKTPGAIVAMLTVVALMAGATTIALAFSMAFPIPWDGLGKVGSIALHLSPHLLLGSLAALLLVLVSSSARARVAAGIFTIVMGMTAILAVAPVIALQRAANRLGVPLSVGEYVANAARINVGGPREDLSVVYGTARDGSKLRLDVWRTGDSDEGPRRPAMLILHGGAWNHGTRSMTPDWDRWFSARGYEVFDVEYRLAPPVRWLDEIGDVKSALGWVAEHADQYHLDPARICVMGQSAGGNLAMLAAYSMEDARLPASTAVPNVAVRAVINLYGPTDLGLLYQQSHSLAYARAALEEYIGGSPAQVPERYRMLSPLMHVGPKSPPTLSLLGGSDRLIVSEHVTRLARALDAVGVANETILLPACDHGFDFIWGGFGTQIARARIRQFLGRYDPQ